MKPRNKRERHYVALAERLPDISGKVLEWAKSTMFEHSKVGYYYKRSSTIWCMCCGHAGQSSGCDLADALVYECPKCGRTLSIYTSHARQQMHEEKWFYVVDVFEGNQVIRMMEASRWNEEKGVPTSYSVREIFQKWLLPDGGEVITSRPYSRSPFYSLIIHDKSYGVACHNESCNGSYYFNDMFVCKDYMLYPKVTLIPLLKRNGCSVRFLKYGERHGVDVFNMMQMIITNNTLETLVKVKQNSLALYYIKQPSFNMRDYLHAVNICTRNAYRIGDADLWLDYIHSLIISGKDSHNSKYVCPENLRQAHDKMMEHLGACPHANGQNICDMLARASNYKRKMKRFAGIVMMTKMFSVSPIMTLESLKREGEEMAHCVFKNKYDRKNSLILSVRARSRKRDRIATVEVGLDTFTILQCRGKNNTMPAYYNEICDVIKINMPSIRRAANERYEGE